MFLENEWDSQGIPIFFKWFILFCLTSPLGQIIEYSHSGQKLIREIAIRANLIVPGNKVHFFAISIFDVNEL